MHWNEVYWKAKGAEESPFISVRMQIPSKQFFALLFLQIGSVFAEQWQIYLTNLEYSLILTKLIWLRINQSRWWPHRLVRPLQASSQRPRTVKPGSQLPTKSAKSFGCSTIDQIKYRRGFRQQMLHLDNSL